MGRKRAFAGMIVVLGWMVLPTAGRGAEPEASPQTGPGAKPAGTKRLTDTKDAKASEHVNRRLPEWFRLDGEFRTRAEGHTGIGYQQGEDDGYALTRFRLRLDIRPTSWMRMFVEGQDSRVAAIDPSRAGPKLKNPMDLRQAYVYLGSEEQGWLGMRVGRQALSYGDERLIGAPGWSNVSRTFDAARLELRGNGAQVDIFAASVVKIDPRAFDKHRDGENFYGIYSTLTKTIPHGVLEPYLLYKTDPLVAGELNSVGDLDLHTVGFRAVSQAGTQALGGMDYKVEMARQGGSRASADVSAWAGAWTLGYTAFNTPLTPRVSAEYDYATGDKDAADGRIGTFDQLYPTNHSKYGITDSVGWRNMKDLRVGTDFKPHRRLKMAVDYHWFWLASRYDHLYNSGGRIAVRAPAGGAQHTDIGQELDITAMYKLSAVLGVGGGFGHLFPGRFIKENSPGSSTSYPYFFVDYKF